MTSYARSTRTQVAIVGGGPAGLMLSHLLHVAGIESVVVDNRTVGEIETTHHAGILERDSVRLLTYSGVSDRVLTEGDRPRIPPSGPTTGSGASFRPGSRARGASRCRRAPAPGKSAEFDELRQLDELTTLVSSEAGSTYRAEGYSE